MDYDLRDGHVKTGTTCNFILQYFASLDKLARIADCSRSVAHNASNGASLKIESATRVAQYILDNLPELEARKKLAVKEARKILRDANTNRN